jgi:hypothetical protein
MTTNKNQGEKEIMQKFKIGDPITVARPQPFGFIVNAIITSIHGIINPRIGFVDASGTPYTITRRQLGKLKNGMYTVPTRK